jgi:hypothetical protein
VLSTAFPTHGEDLYDVTDSSWVSIRVYSRVFRFYYTEGASGRHYLSSQNFSIFSPALVIMHLVWLARFVA